MLGNQSLSGNEPNELYRNDGPGRFTRVSFINGTGSYQDCRGFVPADFDRDGDLDLFVFSNKQPALYLENQLQADRFWLTVRLEGTGANRFGIGARVTLRSGEQRQQTREIHLGSGYLAGMPPEAHFGLGETDAIDSIEVRWPSGETQVVENVTANQVLVIRQGQGHEIWSAGGAAK